METLQKRNWLIIESRFSVYKHFITSRFPITNIKILHAQFLCRSSKVFMSAAREKNPLFKVRETLVAKCELLLQGASPVD